MPQNNLGTVSGVISESARNYSTDNLKESEIALRWLRSSKSMAGKLFSTGGRKVAVLEPGEPNRDSGPDFLGAMLLIDGEVKRGDVEIHLRARSWYEHNHHNDPAFANVILHVVAFEPKGDHTIDHAGRIIPTLLFPLSEDWNARLSHKLQWPWNEGCYHERPEMREGEIYLELLRLGKERLNHKRKSFKLQLEAGHSYGDIFYKGLARALGYSKNSTQFSRFSRLLSLGDIQRVIGRDGAESKADMRLEALLFGFSGLIETGSSDRRRRVLTRKWREISQLTEHAPMDGSDWKFFRLRPQNFPTRRMAALAGFLKRYDPERFVQLAAFAAVNFNSPEKFIMALEESLIIRGDSYWNRMSRFGKDLPRRSALIGKSRARTIVLNVVLPLLGVFAVEESDGALEARVNRIAFIYPPEQDNLILRHIRRFVLPCSPDHPMFSSSAIVQQGMIHLYNRWCSRGEVQNCPLSIQRKGELFG